MTTAGGNGPGDGLWRLRWDDIENPAAGGTLTLLLDARQYGQTGTFLFDAQVHMPPVNNVAEYAERGQLMRMRVADWRAVYGS